MLPAETTFGQGGFTQSSGASGQLDSAVSTGGLATGDKIFGSFGAGRSDGLDIFA